MSVCKWLTIATSWVIDRNTITHIPNQQISILLYIEASAISLHVCVHVCACMDVRCEMCCKVL